MSFICLFGLIDTPFPLCKYFITTHSIITLLPSVTHSILIFFRLTFTNHQLSERVKELEAADYTSALDERAKALTDAEETLKNKVGCLF